MKWYDYLWIVFAWFMIVYIIVGDIIWFDAIMRHGYARMIDDVWDLIEIIFYNFLLLYFICIIKGEKK